MNKSASPESSTPILYSSLAGWWHLLSDPADYADEAATFRDIFAAHSQPIRTLVEFGSGGGNNASHLKNHFKMTLVDLAPEMLRTSRELNPELEHIEGDMRTVRLGRLFDGVFIHDAIMYLTTLAELRAAFQTASAHCRVGGLALFVPDYVRETFRAETSLGGHDDATRGLRYLEWTYDPDPTDTTYRSDFVYLLREGADTIRTELDRHVEGLFPRDEWLRLLRETGFVPRIAGDQYGRELFVAVKSP
ncbi:MAG TPA: class I SAM-dependent methyltransferase [Anaerolineae bacterium]